MESVDEGFDGRTVGRAKGLLGCRELSDGSANGSRRVEGTPSGSRAVKTVATERCSRDPALCVVPEGRNGEEGDAVAVARLMTSPT